ncbi:MAG: hypothetical protein H0X37_26750 [Herpetosiphonaceae bacterium]|nr:hypothetical protein [Herpetosiphonaceae bacterium]
MPGKRRSVGRLGFDEWLQLCGVTLAHALDEQRAVICGTVSAHMAAQFPTLCYDPHLPDPLKYHHAVMIQTPLRFHALLQTALKLRMLIVIEREYRWARQVLPLHGVTLLHMLTHAELYFDVAADSVTLDQIGHVHLFTLKHVTLDMIERGMTA